MGIAGDITIIVVAALAGGMIAQRLRMPAILGYILAGIIVGPYTYGPTVVNSKDVELLADIGVALLMFTVGLEFPIERLAPVRKIALIGTPLQIVLCIGWGFLIGKCMGWSSIHSLWLGCLISVSSTMVVLKIFSDRGLTGTLSSRVMTAILIVQDLAVIPMTILLPALNNPETGVSALIRALVLSAIFIGIMATLGTKWLPRLVQKIALLRSRELFMVAILAIGLGTGYATNMIGLSFAFGAFLAGMVLSRSDFNHQAMSEVTPLKDLFSMLFFVSVGMMIDPAFIADHWLTLIMLILAIFIGKSLIFAVTTRMFGYVNIMPIAVGLSMFEIGEFAFVLARQGVSTGSIDQNVYMHILTAAAITMAITPFVAQFADPLYQAWRQHFHVKKANNITIEDQSMSKHLVLIGYGRMGRFIVQALESYKDNILVLEEHPEHIAAAKQQGLHTIGGDANSETILKACDLDKASAVMLTIPNPITSTMIMRKIHAISPQLEVLARAANLQHMQELTQYGASSVLVPELEASLGLLRQGAVLMGESKDSIDANMDKLRALFYSDMEESKA